MPQREEDERVPATGRFDSARGDVFEHKMQLYEKAEQQKLKLQLGDSGGGNMQGGVKM